MRKTTIIQNSKADCTQFMPTVKNVFPNTIQKPVFENSIVVQANYILKLYLYNLFPTIYNDQCRAYKNLVSKNVIT